MAPRLSPPKRLEVPPTIQDVELRLAPAWPKIEKECQRSFSHSLKCCLNLSFYFAETANWNHNYIRVKKQALNYLDFELHRMIESLESLESLTQAPLVYYSADIKLYRQYLAHTKILHEVISVERTKIPALTPAHRPVNKAEDQLYRHLAEFFALADTSISGRQRRFSVFLAALFDHGLGSQLQRRLILRVDKKRFSERALAQLKALGDAPEWALKYQSVLEFNSDVECSMPLNQLFFGPPPDC